MTMSTWGKMAACVCMTALVSACATTADPSGNTGGHSQAIGGATMGAVLGGVAGALFGGKKGAVIGALAGAALGGGIGYELDQRDQAAHQAAVQQSMQKAAPNHTVAWRNPDTGDSGTLTPLNSYTVAAGNGGSEVCRTTRETYVKAGRTLTATAKYCRNADGQWVPQG